MSFVGVSVSVAVLVLDLDNLNLDYLDLYLGLNPLGL